MSGRNIAVGRMLGLSWRRGKEKVEKMMEEWDRTELTPAPLPLSPGSPYLINYRSLKCQEAMV